MTGAMLLPLALLAMVSSGFAHAASDGPPKAALFDRPVATRTIGSSKCTAYADLLVREVDVDTPAPGAAAIIPMSNDGPRLSCAGQHHLGEITLRTEGFAFAGRKGPFLFFSEADPNGAVPFMIFHGVDGRLVYRDATAEGTWRTVAADTSGLRLRFTRGANSACSLVERTGACWSRMAREGQLAKGIDQLPAPFRLCAAAYRRAKAPASVPSVITYAVDMSLDVSGQPVVHSTGAMGCEPLP